MKICYLGHSGFLVETESARYLFDYIRGELPEDGEDRPLFVFASHFHGDHFDPRIFRDPVPSQAKAYILGDDVRTQCHSQCRPFTDRILWAKAGDTLSLPGGPEVLCLDSTDSGVAFLVRDPEGAIFHAGDLNWWHWEGEPDEDNQWMAKTYCLEIDKLKEENIQLAFVPLDPRLEEAAGYGLEYFLRTNSCPYVFPMHFWKDYSVIHAFIRRYGYGDRVQLLRKEGEWTSI